MLDSKNVLLGGTALNIGAQMSKESLGKVMWHKTDYADWVEPLQRAMIEFGITTPQRIAAFLAQIEQESAGMSNLRESFNYTKDALAATFSYLRTHTGRDAAGNVVTLANLWGRPNGTKAGTGHDVPLATQILIANTAYSKEAKPSLDNGTIASGDGWKFRGHGLKQITGRGNTQAFADYVGGALGAAIMANPDLLASDKTLAARSAAWFWEKRSNAGDGGLNGFADRLNMTGNAIEQDRFSDISRGIGSIAGQSHLIPIDKHEENQLTH